MPDETYRVELAGPAAEDFDGIIDWTFAQFGDRAAERYVDLINRSLGDLEEDPFRVGSREVQGAPAVLTYHLINSRERARSDLGMVRSPRHLVAYRVQNRTVTVLRILHDAQDISRHVADMD